VTDDNFDGSAHNRHGADDQQPSDVALAHLRGSAETLYSRYRLTPRGAMWRPNTAFQWRPPRLLRRKAA
jgi:hypothetical protein